MAYTLTVTVPRPHDETLGRVRDALAGQGFGIITEIDMAATLEQKLGVVSDPYVILGACNPPLAHRAVTADPSAGALLPCNVVVRAAGDATIVEALDPDAMMRLAEAPELAEIAEQARQKLRAALDALPSAEII